MTALDARKLALLRQAAQGYPFDVPHPDSDLLVLLLLEKFVRVVTETDTCFVPALTESGQRLLLTLQPIESNV